ncbi:MAG TPA: LacI family DNA-binding transcriptional regulator [Armatimonadota bacterium]|jgi:LacI family transcriptional regulator
MAVTIQDIADRLHLSNSTVSRVLNNKGKDFISEATRQRVLTMAGEMGYRPNLAARALVCGRTDLCALWLPRPYSAYYAQLVYLVTTALNAAGLDVLTKEVQLQDEAPQPHSSRFLTLPVDGILACDADRDVQRYLAQFPHHNTPMVSMGSYCSSQCDYVAIDNSAVAGQAVQHLADVGCRRIAHVLPHISHHAGEWRRDAYLQFMEHTGRAPELVLCPETSRKSARDTMRGYIAAHGCPDGIFCHNDDLAIGVYRALCELGYRVPDDVALIGCDGIADIEYLEIQLSTIASPVQEMCQLACQLLLQRLQHPDLPLQQHLLTSHLVIRQSSQR